MGDKFLTPKAIANKIKVSKSSERGRTLAMVVIAAASQRQHCFCVQSSLLPLSLPSLSLSQAKGLQKLRWYCELCQKQCRDENGFKCHCMSESHLRQMAVFRDNPTALMDEFSREFEKTFMEIMKRKGGKRVRANTVYQEVIQDRHHIHMNVSNEGKGCECIAVLLHQCCFSTATNVIILLRCCTLLSCLQ